jgi:hypothetical protein
MSQNNKSKKQLGVSLYISLIIVTIMLTMVFGLTAIMYSQMKIIRGLGQSVVAFYAADTGVERVLYDVRKEGGGGNFYGQEIFLDPTNSSYNTATASCYTDRICIRSIGTFKETKRAIEASY